MTMIILSQQAAQAVLLVLESHGGQLVWAGVTPWLPFTLCPQRHWAVELCCPPALLLRRGAQCSLTPQPFHLMWSLPATGEVVVIFTPGEV